MLFTSYEFIVFTTVLLLLYYLLPKRQQWKVLLIFSYLFYYLAGAWQLAYITVTTVTVFITARVIEKLKQKQSADIKENKEIWSREDRKKYKTYIKSKERKWLIVCLIFNLGILAIVKYGNFTIANINAVCRLFKSSGELSFWDIALPMGISFYTFQAIGYLIDVYRGTCQAERNLGKFALFVSFFPQLVQGPISRFGDLSENLYQEHTFNRQQICYGLQRILWGFFKKLVIADRILIGVNTIIRQPESHTGAWVFVGMIFYALELYADFTGGIDITIGVAQMLGIKVTENFKRPYFSKSVKEYWRRWHITMGTWFTDYIFYPISVCQPMLRLSKFCRRKWGEQVGKRVPIYLSSFAVWLTTGIWHGASWNFIVWGLGNWAVIMISQEFEPLYAKIHGRLHISEKRWFRIFQVMRTVLLLSCLRTFDCYRDVPLTFQMFGTLFTEKNWEIFWNGALLQIGLTAADYIVLAAALLILVTVSLEQRKGGVRERLEEKNYWVRLAVWYGLFLIILLTGIYGIGYDQSQFIYNQF